MIIRSVHVQNFRCIKDETLPCDDLTVLLGANGSGKSAFLRAIEMFFTPVAKYDREDFHNENTLQPIVITLVFGELSLQEEDTFQKYIERGELVVQKEMMWPGNKTDQKYHGMSLQNPEFEPFWRATSAADRREAYRELRARGRYPELPNWTNQETARQIIMNWEEEHPDKCKRQRDEGQFFGFREVGEARLERYTRFLFIPAVLEASEEAAERKGSALAELLDLVVRSVIAQREEVKQFEAETQRRYDEVMDPEKIGELQTLATDLDKTLKTYAPGASLQLPWRVADSIEIPLPKADPKLVEDEYATAVERAGHGLQRAFVLTLLQHLAVAQAPVVEASEYAATEEGTRDGGNQRAQVTPSLILAIEEPELYQHPNRQRHLSRILMQLATGHIPGVAARTQVMYTSHAPLFVDINRTNKIRVLRKVTGDEGDPRHTRVSATSLAAVASEIEKADGKPDGTYTEAGLVPRLVALMTPWLNEGFFARVAVLVEGEGDRAAILGTAMAMGHEFESKGISVIPCNGKANLDRPTVIFRGLGIPIYTVWDSDKGNDDPKPEVNRRLLKLVGETLDDWPHGVYPTYACFERDLDTTLKAEIGSDLYGSLVGKFKSEFGYATKEQSRKSPMVIQRVIEESRDQGKISATLEEIVSRIVDLV